MKNNNLIAIQIFLNLKKMFLTVQDFFKSHKMIKYLVGTDNNTALVLLLSNPPALVLLPFDNL